MDFGSFFALLVISIVVAAILHYGLKFYVRAGLTSFVSKVIFGYIGASWFGAMFGQWGPTNGTVYYVPAVLGAAALLVVVVDIVKTVHSK